MAVTGDQVFKIAMNLMDEVKKDGSIGVAESQAYRAKSPSILTVLQTELLPRDISPVIVSDLASDLLLDDQVCLLALPYGLASHLMLTEDTAIAAFFNDRYEELKRNVPTAATVIADVYGMRMV